MAKLNNTIVLGKLRTDLDKVLAIVGKKYGCSFDVGNFRYEHDGSQMQMHVTASAHAADGTKVESPESRNWNTYRSYYGLAHVELGARFWVSGTPYIIAGLKGSRPRFPILGKRERDGKMFKFPSASVLRSLPVFKAAA